MPFIKFKPFALDSALCYKCGREIKQGSLNWTYNTHSVSMFRHQNCQISDEEFKKSVIEAKTEEKIPEKLQDGIGLKMPQTEIPSYKSELKLDLTDLITLEGKHNQTTYIKALLKLREYPFLYGSPGAGKTHLVTQISEDMALDCVIISCSADMLKSEIFGGVNPLNGTYHSSVFRKCWQNGGVILFDEVGLASGSFLNIMNAALAQKELRFPDGQRVKMHENTFILFADNSALYGNDPLFPERQDAGNAFRDRLAYVAFEYDEALELQIIKNRFNGDSSRAQKWHNVVKSIRSKIATLNVPIFASPRFAYAGAKAFKAGLTYNQVMESYLLCGINGDIKKLVEPIIECFRGNY